jgi:excisionase family DNA binding protein
VIAWPSSPLLGLRCREALELSQHSYRMFAVIAERSAELIEDDFFLATICFLIAQKDRLDIFLLGSRTHGCPPFEERFWVTSFMSQRFLQFICSVTFIVRQFVTLITLIYSSDSADNYNARCGGPNPPRSRGSSKEQYEPIKRIMEKLCIVRRRKPETQIGMGVAESMDYCVADGPRHEAIRASDRVSLAWEYPLRSDLAGPDDQKLSIELTPTQANVVKSHAYFKLLLGAEVDGSSVGVQRSDNGEIIFNFYFKQVYLSKMLTSSDVCNMLQISRAFLARLAKAGKLKSYKIGRLRRFSLEDILAHLSESVDVLVKGEDHVL